MVSQSKLGKQFWVKINSDLINPKTISFKSFRFFNKNIYGQSLKNETFSVY